MLTMVRVMMNIRIMSMSMSMMTMRMTMIMMMVVMRTIRTTMVISLPSLLDLVLDDDDGSYR